jgi:siderophore synthetase component
MVSLGAVRMFFRGLQARYLASSAKLTEFLNNLKALDKCFESL